MLSRNHTFEPIPNARVLSEQGEWRDLTPEELLLEFGAVVRKKGDETEIAACNPNTPGLREYATQRFPGTIRWYTMTEEDRYTALRVSEVDLRGEIARLVVSNADEDTRIPRLVTMIVQCAIKEGASDIHIEPRRHDAVVRFRLDGELREVVSLSRETCVPLVARVKILANMKTDETRRPQDGRFEPDGCRDISMRVSVMPVLYGEKVVMRVLNESKGVLGLDDLGFSETHQEMIRRNMDKPYGMIIASGPTGSGKTTTLYSLLQLLHAETQNIATLEDPVESGLDKVNQTQVNPDLHFSFANGLRSLLRQDPDVILVGEIRDEETVTMAAQASMTGHLVLTSLHTNDAAGAFTRFMEMGVDDFMTASVVNLVVAQRLVRSLCTHCAKEKSLDPVIVKKIRERADVMEALKKVAPKVVDSLETRSFKSKVGCDKCMHTGYKGRSGIFELLEMNKDVHDLILTKASSSAIEEAATRHGFETMVTHGVRRVLAGATTFDEVLRVTRGS